MNWRTQLAHVPGIAASSLTKIVDIGNYVTGGRYLSAEGEAIISRRRILGFDHARRYERAGEHELLRSSPVTLVSDLKSKFCVARWNRFVLER